MRQFSLPIRHSVRPPAWNPDTPPSLDGVDTVFLDAETDGLEWHKGARPVGWAVKWAGAPGRYLPFGHRGGGNLDEAVVKRWAERELRGKRIVNLYTKFDAHMARVWGVDLIEQGCTLHDVSHAEALLDDHCRDFSLDGIAQRRLGIGKLDIGPKAEIAELPAWDVAPYAIRDVDLPEQIAAIQQPLLEAEDLLRVMALEDAVLPVVVEMEHNGTPIDEELLHLWTRQSEAVLERMLWEINRAAGFSVNPDKTDDLVRLFKLRGIENPHRTASGAPSFTAEFMRTITDDVINKTYRAGKLIDLRNKFLLPYGKLIYNGHLWPTMHQLMTGEGGTVSGRFSFARPNLQQVMTPDKQERDYGDYLLPDNTEEGFIIKKLFREKDGASWFCADQEQVEFRIFGHYADAKKIIEAYAADPSFADFDGKQVAVTGPHADFHVVVTRMIRTVRPGFPRKQAKNSNFARVYGSGVAKFAAMIGTSEYEAKGVLRIYDREFPEAKALLNLAMETAESRGWVKTLLGRRCRFPMIALPGQKPRRQRTHKALNAVIQGSAADLNKLCLVAVHAVRKALGFVMRLTVHDELNGRLEDPANAPAVMAVLNTQQVPLKVPILWSGSTGATWADAK